MEFPRQLVLLHHGWEDNFVLSGSAPNPRSCPIPGQEGKRVLQGTGSKCLLKEQSKRRTFVPNALEGGGEARHQPGLAPGLREAPLWCLWLSWWCHFHNQARGSLALREKPLTWDLWARPEPWLNSWTPSFSASAPRMLAQGMPPCRAMVRWRPGSQRAPFFLWGPPSFPGSEPWVVKEQRGQGWGSLGSILGYGLGSSGWGRLGRTAHKRRLARAGPRPAATLKALGRGGRVSRQAGSGGGASS